ncbi:MAG: hypothetical protein RBU21_24985 [FCB group bacterium]|jgi:hypothetical protein|nr:hypothetical protein [FCB group bacterium]
MTEEEREQLVLQFDEVMLALYGRTLIEVGWRDFGQLRAIRALGGFVTARVMLDWPTPSEGFAMLCAAGRLDLSTEYLALRSPWRQLFTAENLEVARARLRAHHVALPTDDTEAAA